MVGKTGRLGLEMLARTHRSSEYREDLESCSECAAQVLLLDILFHLMVFRKKHDTFPYLRLT